MRQPAASTVVLLIVLAAICGHARQVQAISLTNGDFETGDLTGWTVFTNSGVSELGEGFPQVVPFDTTGDGVETFSAVVRVGGGGGGFFQDVNLFAGDLTVTLDIAAFAPFSNFSGGLFELSVDSIEIATHDFGFIDGGSTERALLTGTTTVTAGTHRIAINISRSGVGQSSNTPLQFIDNVVLSGAATGPCTLGLEASRTDETLTLDFEVGTREPATWNVWLVAQAEVTPLVSAALPVIEPPVSFEVSLPFFPALGTVGLLTTLTTSTQGIICSAFETVDTGPLAVASAPKGHEIQALFWQHAVGLQDLLK